MRDYLPQKPFLGKIIRCQIHLLRQSKKLRRFSIAYYVLVTAAINSFSNLGAYGWRKRNEVSFFSGGRPLCFSDWGGRVPPRPPPRSRRPWILFNILFLWNAFFVEMFSPLT